MSARTTRPAPLTPLQEGMVFHHLLEGRHSGVDVEQVVGELGETLEQDTFVRAWEAVVARHDVLRTTVRWEGAGTPEGIVHSEVRIPVLREDHSVLPPDVQEARFRDFLTADRARGFDLAEPPLMRLALFRLEDRRYRMVWTIHHLLVDGRTFALLLREVFGIYEAELEGRSPTPVQRAPYSTYVEWIRSRDPDVSRDFWNALLDGVEEPTPLPLHRPSGPNARHGEREVLSRRIAPETVRRLREAAREVDATLNTFFQAAWALTLSRFGGTQDVVFGAIRGGRAGTVPDAASMVGLFIHVLPVRVDLREPRDLRSLVRTLRRDWVAMRDHEFVPLSRIQEWSRIPSGTPLFHSVVNFQDPPWTDALASLGGLWEHRSFHVRNRLPYPLMVRGSAGSDLLVSMEYDPDLFDTPTVDRMMGRMAGLLEEFRWEPSIPLRALAGPLREERRELVCVGNDIQVPVPEAGTVHGLIEEQAGRSPDAVAILQGNESWTYRELIARSGRVSRRLAERNIGRGDRVGILMDRTPAMVAALLGTLRSGAAYVPLDPAYPPERIQMVLEDAGVVAILASPGVGEHVPTGDVPTLIVDDSALEETAPADPPDIPSRTARPFDPAYVIYTSGSTGRPKGVVIEHRSVVNFFLGMDDRIAGPRPGTWLAVTSISFDISVLELLWTLARGFRVAIHGDPRRPAVQRRSRRPDGRTLECGLFYFSAETNGHPLAPGPDRYRLLIEGAKLADRMGLDAVWTPERHFHPFGGIYPNPSVVSAALAAVTRRIQIRAGSVVLPLHDPIRVAEEWAIVDNLSGGRVGLSFASGWHDRDFVLAPDRYADRRNEMFRGIETIRALWRGESIERTKPDGSRIEVQLHPLPVQPELPFFVTAGGSPETFRRAGEIGAGLLTHLLGQSPDTLRERIAAYREAWKEAGHAGEGRVALMLHTFLGHDEDEVREKVRAPFQAYLESSVGLIAGLAEERGRDLRSPEFTKADMDALLAHAFDRYYETSALMGTPERARETVERMGAAGVDELACLIDFGVDEDEVLAGLHLLPEVFSPGNGNGARPPRPDEAGEAHPATVGEAIRAYGVTHLQCTPSLLRLLLAEEDTRTALGELDVLLVGGEAFPSSLAAEVLSVTGAEVLNMYGPTETTIWSSTHRVGPEDANGTVVPLGRPIANTGMYVLDPEGVPAPIGVTGELWIGGKGVARGYHDRRTLTKERFVGGLLPEVPGRLYRTGDLVRLRDDGVLEFAGRVDDQIKLRGHRIEPGEIEAALNELPAVTGSVVVLREDGGEPRLVAYVVPAGPEPTEGELRRRLARRLPEVMLPARFVFLESFPLTPNGKIDRQRLPGPEQRASSGEGGVPSGNDADAVRPEDNLERVIAEIWSEVLRTPDVGLHDNFFDLGGHSLLTIRVQDRLRTRLNANVTLRDLFRFTTVRSLARHLSDGDRQGKDEPLLERAAARARARREARGDAPKAATQ